MTAAPCPARAALHPPGPGTSPDGRLTLGELSWRPKDLESSLAVTADESRATNLQTQDCSHVTVALSSTSFSVSYFPYNILFLPSLPDSL